jgi:hypothetical protein
VQTHQSNAKAAAGPAAPKATAAADQRRLSSHKTGELAASSSSTGQLSVVLALLAIIALALVAATYARLYILGNANGGSDSD